MIANITPKWIKPVLLISLALNMAIIGLGAGFWIRAEMRHREMGQHDRQLAWIYRLLPHERHDLANKIMTQHKEEADAMRSRLDMATKSMIAALRAEPYTPEAMTEAMQERLDVSTAHRALIQQQVLEIVQELTPAERGVFADNLERRLEHKRR